MEGVNGLMIAADVHGDGHYTDYPADKPTVALQLSFEGGRVMEHRLIKKGVCGFDDRTLESESGSGRTTWTQMPFIKGESTMDQTK
jgi:hypothetical protein